MNGGGGGWLRPPPPPPPQGYARSTTDHHASKAIYIHHNDNIEKYGLLTRAYPIFSDAQTPVDDRYEARCRNKLRCLSRVCKFFHCAANTLIFSGYEAKNVKASGAPPQAPMGEITAPLYPLAGEWVDPAPGRPSNQPPPPPHSPIPRSATDWRQFNTRIGRATPN